MKNRYEMGNAQAPSNARNMKVLLADSPQLAVVIGLVLAQIQRCKSGVNVYAKKRCPISLGILCRKPYNVTEHQGEVVELDPYDKKRWAERQIEWIIRKVSVSALKVYQQLTHQRAKWSTQIGAKSTGTAERLI
jgi:hypothetical protein